MKNAYTVQKHSVKNRPYCMDSLLFFGVSFSDLSGLYSSTCVSIVSIPSVLTMLSAWTASGYKRTISELETHPLFQVKLC